MPIYLLCAKCKTRNTVKAKKCKKCGYVFPYQGREYNVEVKHKDKRIARVVSSLVVARETEATLKDDLIRGKLKIKKKESLPLVKYGTGTCLLRKRKRNPGKLTFISIRHIYSLDWVRRG